MSILVAGESLIDLIVTPDGAVRASPGGAAFNAARTIARLDPNCRPRAIPDADAYLARIRRILARTDIVKVSTEDLAFLAPGTDVPEAASTLLGGRAGAVLVTDGPALIRAYAREGDIAVAVPPVQVADTVGAGDAFGGAFLAWWAEHGLTREDLADPALLRAAVTAAARVSSLTCSRAGAEPPWRHELAAGEGWDPLPAPARRR
jgi:fructokinase